MIKFNGVLQPDEEIVIDLENYTATIRGVNALPQLTESTEFEVYLKNGSNTITYNGNVPASLSCSFNERWR